MRSEPTGLGWVAGLGMALVLGRAVLGQTLPAEEAGGKWISVVYRLKSEVFAEREAAQKQLEGATWRDAEVLRGLARTATDPEAKARLEKKLEVLGMEGLVRPHAVTLEVKEAGIKELAGALTAATGVEWSAWDRGRVEGPWSLKVEERPLWEVFLALEKQAQVHVRHFQGKVMLVPGPSIPGGLGPIEGEWAEAVAGDFLLHAGIGARRGPAAVGKVQVQYGVRGDPRLRLVRCGMPEILSVVDEKGNVLHKAEARVDPWWVSGTEVMAEINTAMEFKAVEGMGKKLTIRGQMVVRRAVASERVEMGEVTNQAKDPVQVGGRVWRLWAVDPMADEGWVLNITERRQGAAGPRKDVPLWLKLMDAGGTQVWEGVVDGQVSVRLKLGAVKKPLKAVLVAGEGTVEEVVGFEIRDVVVR